MVCRLRRQALSLSYFQPIGFQGIPDENVLKRVFPCPRPFSIAHHAVHIACLNQFSAFFWASTLLSFYLRYYSMSEPRVLVLDDSFIRRLRFFLSRDSPHFSFDFKLSHCALIKWHGVGGRTVSKALQLDLNVIQSFFDRR